MRPVVLLGLSEAGCLVGRSPLLRLVYTAEIKYRGGVHSNSRKKPRSSPNTLGVISSGPQTVWPEIVLSVSAGITSPLVVL